MYAPDYRALSQSVTRGTDAYPPAVSHDARLVSMADRYADESIASLAAEVRSLMTDRATRDARELRARRAAAAVETVTVCAAVAAVAVLLSIGGPDLIAGIVTSIPATLQVVIRLARLAA